MAISFNKAKGSAKKGSIDSYQYKNGDNKVRMVGKLLARYVYWVPGFNNKTVPVECLSFDRDAEAFTNKEHDYVKEYYPDLQCAWAYSILCIDPDDGKVKVLNLKKKLLEQIITAAEDLGDPTDPETGWQIAFKRVKTGPMVYNVEYRFQPLKCKPEPLTEEEKLAVEESQSIEEMLPRQTPEAQKKFLDEMRAKVATEESEIDPEVEDAFDVE